MLIKEQLEFANSYINKALNLLEEAPEADALVSLLLRCRALDEYYKQWCNDLDNLYGDEPGTAYKEGTSMEFYIESSDWHALSLELRKLEEKLNN